MPVTSPGFDPAAVMRGFAARYKERFDIELTEMRAMLVNLRTSVQGIRPKVGMEVFAPAPSTASAAGPRTVRAVTFGGRVHETPVWQRESIPVGHVLRGPLIVEQMDATTVVDPGARLEVDRLGNLIITVGGGA
jgi:N-methylhydantoinase A